MVQTLVELEENKIEIDAQEKIKPIKILLG